MCEGYITVGCEAQFPALLEGQGIPFTFTDSAMLALCLDKKGQGAWNTSVSWPTPEFDLWSVIGRFAHREARKDYPLFVKPAYASSKIGVSQANKVCSHEDIVHTIKIISKEYPS